MRILELFSGIGAVSEAADDHDEVVCAIDISQLALQVYRCNFTSPTLVQEITSLTIQQLSGFGADLWWMSPPCQPYTRRGLQKDLDDPRTRPLLHLLDAIVQIRPPHIAIENVVGFESSQSFRLLNNRLAEAGYRLATSLLCSTRFGLPNLRPRFFIIASRNKLPEFAQLDELTSRESVASFLDSASQRLRWKGDLAVESEMLAAYREAINIATSDSNQTRCFTSAYGRSIVRSGSYLEIDGGFRRFSPTEEARLLGFSNRYQLPATLSTRQLWKLLGNTVSVPCARHVLKAFETTNARE